ncbi:MAG: carbohydrate ABC transporter permease [Clostridiaceae bacterium]|jgi:putative aldouronate transport system permease protein|nr:carbohydrate ABC transporter permease [Clostridiaceae bacterium]
MANKSDFKYANYTKSKAIDLAADIFIYITVALLSILCVLPFIHVIAKSLSSDAKVTSQLVYLIPKDFNLKAYKSVFGDPSMIRSLWQTIKVTVLFTALGMFLTICAAYPLTRKRLKGRNIISIFFIITLYFSGGIIPDYLLMHRLGLLNNSASLILPLAFSAYNMIIMRTSIQSTVPDSLEESAFLDGAGDIRILVQIVLPLCKPIIATLCLFYAVGRWNAYQDSVFYITRQPLYLLQHKLNLLIQTTNTTLTSSEAQPDTVTNPEVIKSACIIFATLPIIITYPFVQKYFVKGVMIGAVKG